MKASKILFKGAELAESGAWTRCNLQLIHDQFETNCALGLINRAWGNKKIIYNSLKKMRYPGEDDLDFKGAMDAVKALAVQLCSEQSNGKNRSILPGLLPVILSGNARDQQYNTAVYNWNDAQRDRRVIARKFRKVARMLEREGK